MADPENIQEAIQENAKGVSEATIDGQTVKQHSLRDQIAADDHINAKTAAARKGYGVIRAKFRPPEAHG